MMGCDYCDYMLPCEKCFGDFFRDKISWLGNLLQPIMPLPQSDFQGNYGAAMEESA